MTENLQPYEVIKGDEHLAIDPDTERIYAGEWQREMMEKDNNMITIGTHNDPMRGPQAPSKLTVNSMFRHTLIAGQTGSGKSTLIRNIQLQLINQGYGLTFIDQKGTDSYEFLKQIPENRLDDIVWIEPDSDRDSDNRSQSIGFNSFETHLEPDAENYDKAVNEFSTVFVSLLKNKSDYWGPQIGYMTETLVKQLIKSDYSFNPIDLVRILSDEEQMSLFVEKYEDELEQAFLNRISEQDLDAFDPILRRIRGWVEDRTTRQFIASERLIFNLRKAIKDNKIIILNLSNINNPSVKKTISHLYINNLWSNVKAINESSNHFLVLDDYDSLCSDSFNVNNILSQGRSLEFGLIIGTQQFNNIPQDAKQGVRQVKHQITMNLGNSLSDASSAAQFYNIGSQEIKNLSQFEAISYVMSENGYTSDEPVTISLFNEIPHKTTDIEHIISKSIDKYSSERKEVIDLKDFGISRHLD